MKDRNVMSSLYQMDAKQFDLLSQQIDKLKSDVGVNKSIEGLNAAKT